MVTRIINTWHIGAWNRNFGDWTLAYQLHRRLNEQAEKRGLYLRFYLVDAQRTGFYPELVDHMNAEADLIIWGGSLFHRPEDHSQSGWMFNISLEDLERITPPVVVNAIGYNVFPYDTTDFPDVTYEHFPKLQEKAALFSTRNTGSKEVFVEKFGLKGETIAITPDPGLCVYDRAIHLPVRRSGGPLIAVNLAGDRPHFRFSPPHEEHERRFLQGLRRVLLRCVRELDATVMFLPHLVNVDTDLYASFAQDFPEGTIFSTYDVVRQLYPPPGELMYPHVPFFTNLYRQADLVVGMRGHACIIPFGAKTKFMPLGEHPKVGYFAADVGVPPQYVVPTLSDSDDAVDAMFQRVCSCLSDNAYDRLLDTSLRHQLDRFDAFNERVLDLVSKD